MKLFWQVQSKDSVLCTAFDNLSLNTISDSLQLRNHDLKLNSVFPRQINVCKITFLWSLGPRAPPGADPFRLKKSNLLFMSACDMRHTNTGMARPMPTHRRFCTEG